MLSWVMSTVHGTDLILICINKSKLSVNKLISALGIIVFIKCDTVLDSYVPQMNCLKGGEKLIYITVWIQWVPREN